MGYRKDGIVDIRCTKCGEPWSIDSLHDEADWQEVSFDVIRRQFSLKGCEALGCGCNEATLGSNAATVASLAEELMGDDIDGIASMLEDAGMMGLLD